MRQPVVSRTFRGYVFKALVLNMETRQQTESEFFIERMPQIKKEKRIDAFIRERIEEQLNDNEKYVTVLSRTPATRRFYMTEPEFIRLAHETTLLPGAAQDKESEE